jgi:hypothetical protein
MHQGLFRDHRAVFAHYALCIQHSSPSTAIKIKPTLVGNYHSRIQERWREEIGGAQTSSKIMQRHQGHSEPNQ